MPGKPLTCATHRQVQAGLADLHQRGVISDGTYAVASQRTTDDCRYLSTERDSTGACILRHP